MGSASALTEGSRLSSTVFVRRLGGSSWSGAPTKDPKGSARSTARSSR